VQQQLSEQPQRVRSAAQSACHVLKGMSLACPSGLLDATVEVLQCLVSLSLNHPPIAEELAANGGWDLTRAGERA